MPKSSHGVAYTCWQADQVSSIIVVDTRGCVTQLISRSAKFAVCCYHLVSFLAKCVLAPFDVWHGVAASCEAGKCLTYIEIGENVLAL